MDLRVFIKPENNHYLGVKRRRLSLYGAGSHFFKLRENVYFFMLKSQRIINFLFTVQNHLITNFN